MKTPERASVILLLPEAYAREGGIQAYNRLLVRSFLDLAREKGARLDCLLLNDPATEGSSQGPPGPADAVRAFGGSRVRFASAAIARALFSRPRLVVVGHLNFAPLAGVIKLLRPKSAVWFVAYGIEAWRRVPWPHRLAIRHADRILSISDYTRRRLAEENGIDRQRMSVLPCALDPAWVAGSAPQVAAGACGLLSVSRLDASERYKGIDDLLRALPAIARQVPDVRYVVVGDGTDRPRLESLARTLGVSSRVEFRGRVSREDLAKAYAECALFAMPSGGEGFGIAFVEAAFFGKPSLACNAGGAPEVVEDDVTGILVRYGDAPEIARKVVALFSQPELLRAMGERARDRALAFFSFEAFVRRLGGHVGNILDRRA